MRFNPAPGKKSSLELRNYAEHELGSSGAMLLSDAMSGKISLDQLSTKSLERIVEVLENFDYNTGSAVHASTIRRIRRNIWKREREIKR